jgi:hypothetical protein
MIETYSQSVVASQVLPDAAKNLAAVPLTISDFPPRVLIASIPRSGNSWMRQLIEAALGRTLNCIRRGLSTR